MPSSSMSDQVGMKYYNCGPVTIPTYGADPTKVVMKRPYLVETNTLNSELKTILDTNKTLGYVQYRGFPYIIDRTGDAYTLGNSTPSFTLPGSNIQYVSFTEYLDVSNATPKLIITNTVPTGSYVSSWDNATFTSSSLINAFFNCYSSQFLDGFIFTGSGNGYIYNSAINNPLSFTLANDFTSAEMYPDPQGGLAKHRNLLVSLGENSIEFFYDGAVQLGSPLLRQAAYAKKLGYVFRNPTSNVGNISYIGDECYLVGDSEANNYGIY